MIIYLHGFKHEVSSKTQRQINWEMFRLGGLNSAAENPFITPTEEDTIKRIARKAKIRALKKTVVNFGRFKDFGIYDNQTSS